MKTKDLYEQFNIPKELNILNYKIRVLFNPQLLKEESKWGISRFQKQLIEIYPGTIDSPQSEETIKETFLHELNHWILYAMGDKKNGTSEEFVEALTKMQRYVFKTNNITFS